MNAFWIAASLFFLPPLPSPAAAQEPHGEGIQDELTRLFRQVEKDLREIDRLLLEAGRERDAAGKSAEAVEGMKKILDEATQKSRAVSGAIDEILRKAPT